MEKTNLFVVEEKTINKLPTKKTTKKRLSLFRGTFNLFACLFFIIKELLKESFYEEIVEKEDPKLLKVEYYEVSIKKDFSGPMMAVKRVSEPNPLDRTVEVYILDKGEEEQTQ